MIILFISDGASRAEFADLLSEYTLLKEVDHPNVIKLLGAATLNGPFHLVVEYCEHGSLKSHLRNVRTQEPIYMNGATQFYTAHAEELMGYSWQISKGMQYLSDMKVCIDQGCSPDENPCVDRYTSSCESYVFAPYDLVHRQVYEQLF